MLFNSYIFIFLFLPLCISVYFLLCKRGWDRPARVWLVGMSLWFYGYINPFYLLLLGVSILGNFGISRLLLYLRRIERKRMAKILMAAGVAANTGLLLYYKYSDFFLANLNTLFHTDFAMRQIVLPLGISFFTFQQISFVVDSYRGEAEAYKLLDYAAFVSFFPQISSGPISFHSEVIPQFLNRENHKPSSQNLAKGLYLFAGGLFKKIIVADTLGKLVALGFGGVEILSSVDVLLVIVSYALQLYYDFSGYSDMAIGIALMFNIELPVNFRSPYKARSILEFWDRWHITLTRFLRKYIYFPLGGSRKGRVRTYVNIMIVFLVSGLWHGANWTFIVWGILHGAAEVLTRRFCNLWGKLSAVLQWLVTFGFVSCAFLIFRADSLSQAYIMFRKVAKLESFSITPTLLDAFTLPEIAHLEKLLHIDVLLNRFGLNMWGFLLLVLFATLRAENFEEKPFVCNKKTLFATIGMLTWAIVSFSGISTFLYFNF